METWQRETVLAVARHKNFLRAADELLLTPAALSVQLSKLEKELGVKLFTVTAHSVRPTPAGEELVKQAAASLAPGHETRGAIRHIAAQEKEHIAVGISDTPMPGSAGPSALLGQFERQHADVIVSVIRGENSRLLDLLESGEIDLAIFMPPAGIAKSAPDVELVDLSPDRFPGICLAIPRRPYLSSAVQAFRRFASVQAAP